MRNDCGDSDSAMLGFQREFLSCAASWLGVRLAMLEGRVSEDQLLGAQIGELDQEIEMKIILEELRSAPR